MSEQQPEPGVPLNPDELRRLEEMVRDTANTPDMMGAAIETIAGMHARWYFAWQGHGVPEPRAAEWAGIMIGTLFDSGS
jgi:hypothetical protein